MSTAPVQPLRTLRLRQSYVAATGTFTFQQDDQSPRTFVTPDTVRNTPPLAFKALRTRIGTENAPTAEGLILVHIGDVFVNGQLYEDFKARPLPLVQILPPTGLFLPNQVVDVAITAETGTDPVVGGRLFVNNDDVTAALGGARIEPLPGGRGVAMRFGRIAMGSIVPPGTRSIVQVELRTATGDTARATAFWTVVPTQ